MKRPPLGHLTRLTILLGLLSGIAIAPPAQALSRQCRWVRQIRQIIINTGSSSRRIIELEYDYCRGRRSRSRPDTTSNCFHLNMMLTLARTAGSRDAGTIASEKSVACAFPDDAPRGLWQYPNGQTVNFGSNWYYPNGQIAKLGQRWNYPNSRVATTGRNWSYPNGRPAISGDRGHLPDGRLVGRIDLLRWSCTQLGSRACENTFVDLAEQAEIVQDAAIVKLAWQATRRSR